MVLSRFYKWFKLRRKYNYSFIIYKADYQIYTYL